MACVGLTALLAAGIADPQLGAPPDVPAGACSQYALVQEAVAADVSRNACNRESSYRIFRAL
jgi:hypothetical protein